MKVFLMLMLLLLKCYEAGDICAAASALCG